MPSIKGEIVLDRWDMSISGGAGRDKWVFDKTEELIKATNVPSIIMARMQLNTAMFGAKRDFLIVRHKSSWFAHF